MAGFPGRASRTGLPSDFGFPRRLLHCAIRTRFLPAAAERRHTTGRYRAGTLRAAVWRQPRWWREAGTDLLRRAAAGENAFFGVLRQAMAADTLVAGGDLFRHQHRQPLRQQRRRRCVVVHRRTPAANLIGRNFCHAELTMAVQHEVAVCLPPALTALFPGCPRQACVEAATVADAIAALDRSWPGLRGRLCDDRPSLRRHIGFMCAARSPAGDSPDGGDEVYIVTAISGG